MPILGLSALPSTPFKNQFEPFLGDAANLLI